MARSRELLAVATATILFCLIAYRSFLYAPGTPNFVHDWAWSPAAAQIADFFRARTSFSRLDSLGGPNTDLAAYPTLFLAALPVWLLGSSAAIKFFLLWTTVAAAAGATALARACRADSSSAILIGLAYAAGPFAFNKIVSGQVTIWLAYAALPFAFWGVRATRDRGVLFAIGATGLSLALVAPQLQIFFVAWIATIVAGVVMIGARGATSALVAGALACATQLPLAVELHHALASDTYSQFFARSPWELMQSPLPRLALRLDGYFTQSYAIATITLHHAAAIAGYGLAALAWFGLIARPGFHKAGWFVAAGAVVLLGVMSAYHLPWASIADALFLSVPAATIFRELYDLMALVAVAYVIGTARATGFALGKFAVWGTSLLVVAVACLAHYDAVLQSSDLRAHLTAFDVLKGMPGDDRIWPQPNGRFLTASGHDAGGFDPFFGRAGSHPIVEEYFPTGPVAVARSMPLRCAEPLLRAMRVRYIWNRLDLVHTPESTSPVGPLAGPHCSGVLRATRVFSSATDTLDEVDEVPTARREIVNVDIVPDDWLDGLASLNRGRDFIFARDARAFGVSESEIEGTPDDRRFVNPREGPVTASLFTGAGLPFVQLAGGASIAAGPALAYLRLNPASRFVYHLTAARFALESCDKVDDCIRSGDFMLFGPSLREPLQRTQALPLPHAHILIVDSQFDPGLHASSGGSEFVHVRVDGYANGWLVPSANTDRITFTDDRTAGLVAAWVIAALAWMAMTAALIGGIARRMAAP